MRAPHCFADGDDLLDVQVGDVVFNMGTPRVISRIEPFDAARVGYPGETWKIAHSEVAGRPAWGITVPVRPRSSRACREES